jgi:hypothetical protein
MKETVLRLIASIFSGPRLLMVALFILASTGNAGPTYSIFLLSDHLSIWFGLLITAGLLPILLILFLACHLKTPSSSSAWVNRNNRRILVVFNFILLVHPAGRVSARGSKTRWLSQKI